MPKELPTKPRPSTREPAALCPAILVAGTHDCVFEAGSAGHTLWLMQLGAAERQRRQRVVELRSARCVNADSDALDA